MTPYSAPGILDISKRITKKKIEDTVSFFYEIPMEQIMSKSRRRERVLCRHIIRYFYNKHISKSPSQAARVYDIDHTTIYHSIKYVEDMMDVDKEFKEEIAIIEAKLRMR